MHKNTSIYLFLGLLGMVSQTEATVQVYFKATSGEEHHAGMMSAEDARTFMDSTVSQQQEILENLLPEEYKGALRWNIAHDQSLAEPSVTLTGDKLVVDALASKIDFQCRGDGLKLYMPEVDKEVFLIKGLYEARDRNPNLLNGLEGRYTSSELLGQLPRYERGYYISLDGSEDAAIPLAAFDRELADKLKLNIYQAGRFFYTSCNTPLQHFVGVYWMYHKYNSQRFSMATYHEQIEGIKCQEVIFDTPENEDQWYSSQEGKQYRPADMDELGSFSEAFQQLRGPCMLHQFTVGTRTFEFSKDQSLVADLNSIGVIQCLASFHMLSELAQEGRFPSAIYRELNLTVAYSKVHRMMSDSITHMAENPGYPAFTDLHFLAEYGTKPEFIAAIQEARVID